MTYRTTRWARMAALLALGACSDEPRLRLPPVSDYAPATDPETDASAQECDQAPNGTPCGEPGGDTHCIFNSCIRNACGDGIKAGDEKCDDGNELDHDGCDAHCRIDRPGCGNGSVDPFEDCDLDDRKRCTEACTFPRCGDSIVSPGEECDEGKTIATRTCTADCRMPALSAAGIDAGLDAGAAAADAGGGSDSDAGGRDAATDSGNDAGHDAAADAAMDAAHAAASDAALDAATEAGAEAGADAAADAGEDASAPSACDECVASQCRSWNGEIDLVSGCFSQVDPSYGADGGDPTFLQRCMDVINCAKLNACAFADPANPGTACYCGSATLDTCSMSGPAGEPKCRLEWQAAAGSANNADVVARMSDFAYPLGWAFFIFSCENVNCGAVCKPAH